MRLHDFKLDRAQVRRRAIENKLTHAGPPKKIRAAVRRWQRAQLGELWPLYASPHRWFPGSPVAFPMLNLLDDCRRVFTGSKLYVDYHSLFFTHTPDARTQLGTALKFYDISLRYAPTPQAKGKVEREHQFWQGRLPAYFASEKIAGRAEANQQIDALRLHHNAKEIHRELRQTPPQA